jgi:hypothetical protein
MIPVFHWDCVFVSGDWLNAGQGDCIYGLGFNFGWISGDPPGYKGLVDASMQFECLCLVLLVGYADYH